MYFPTTNYKRTDYYRVMFLRSWKYFCLWKDCCELEKAEEKLFLLENLQKYFEFVFPHLYFNLAIGKKIRFVYVSKKNQTRKAIFHWFFNLKGTGKGKLVFALLHQSVMPVSLYANDLFWKADFTLREIPEWSISAPWSVCKCSNASGKPASCILPACTYASLSVHFQ